MGNYVAVSNKASKMYRRKSCIFYSVGNKFTAFSFSLDIRECIMDFPFSGSGGIEDNFTSVSTCAMSSLESTNATVLPSYVAIGARVIHVIYGLFIFLLGNFLNSLILLLIMKYRQLRSVSFCIAAQIAIANLCLAVLYGITTIVNNIAGHWILGLEFCIISALLLFLFANLRTLLIFVFVFDRFALVFAPFFYPKYSYKIVTASCLLSWCISVVLSLAIIPPWLDCYRFVDATFFCAYSSRCNSNCVVFYYVYVFAIVIPAICIPTVLFISLYMKGRKIRRMESKILETAKKRISDEDWRALKTFFLLFLAIFLLILPPNFLIYISSFLGTIANNIAIKLSSMTITLLVITDPIIILKNADVKEALKKLMEAINTSIQCKFLKSHFRKEGTKTAERGGCASPTMVTRVNTTEF